MRFALLSDIHGNLTALEAVVKALGDEGQINQVIVAGDLLQGGPRPREVWRRLNDLGWTLIRGNEDETLAGTRQPTEADGYSEQAQAQLAWSRQETGREIRRALAALPLEERVATPAGDLLVVHSSPRAVDDRSGAPHNNPEELAAAYDGTGASVIAFGHWHRSFVRLTPFALLVNVASVGLPQSRLPLAAYTILTAHPDGWTVEQRHVSFDPEAEAHAAELATMPPWHAPGRA